MKCLAAALFCLLACAAQASIVLRSTGGLASLQKLYETGKYEQVIEALPPQTIETYYGQDRAHAYLLLAMSRQRKGDVEGALGVFQLAVQLFPKDINLLSALADLLHGEELDDRARPLYEEVLRIHPNNATAHVGLAEIERSQGFLERSIHHYEQALIELPNNASTWRAFAAVLSERRDYPKAIAAIEKSLSLEPRSPESLEALAIFQYRQGLRREADETIDRAIELAADKKELRLERALWLLEGRELDASLKQAREVLREDAENPLALWIRASVELRRGQRTEAIRDLKAAGSKASQYPFIASVAHAMIERVESAP